MLANDFEKRLLAIDWEACHQWPFPRIPDAIMQFVTASQQGGEGGNLEGALLPRASLTEGAFLAIPFLQELVQDRVGVEGSYYLLHVIAICTNHSENTVPEYRDLVARCRARVVARLDLYLEDLQDIELSIDARSEIIGILTHLPQSRAEWLPTVTRVRGGACDARIASELDELLGTDAE
jgi:hypothetical protein